MHFVLPLIAVLVALAPPLGVAQERAQSPQDPAAREPPAVDAPATATSALRWSFEVFVGGGFAGLAANGDVTWGHRDSRDPAPLDPQPFPDVSHHARERGWAAGFRALRGRWGIEAQYHRVTGRAFHPSALIGELPFRGLDLRSPEEPQDLLTVQGVLEVPMGRRKSVFVGLGAGYARSAGPDTGRIEIRDLPISLRRGGTVVHSLSSSHTPREQRADRLSFLVGGSAGITLRTRQFIVRPRIDVFLGRTRHAEASWDTAAEFDLPHTGRQSVGLGITSLEASVRPLFALLSVDLGWSSRR